MADEANPQQLENFLAHRPSKAELVEQNIMDPDAGRLDPSLIEKKKELEYQQTSDTIEQSLKTRPTPEEFEKSKHGKKVLSPSKDRKKSVFNIFKKKEKEDTDVPDHTTKTTDDRASGNIAGGWEAQQHKTFCRWINSRFHPGSLGVEDLSEDLKDGVKLAALLENISHQHIKVQKNPRMRFQQMENAQACVNFVQESGVKLVNVGSEDVVDGNKKIIMGLIWSIILRFQIQDISVGEKNAKEGLLLWCQKRTAGYAGVNVVDFSSSFQDGLAFCALIHSHSPGVIDFNSLSKSDRVHNLNLAFDTADEYFQIPKLLDVQDFAVKPDERSVMAYVAEYFHRFAKSDSAEVAGKRIVRLLQLTEANDALKEDYTNRARELKTWLGEKHAEFSNTDADLGKSLAEVEEKLAELNSYRNGKRHQKNVEFRQLEKVFHNLSLKLRSVSRPAFQPEKGLSLADLEADFARLTELEHALFERLRAEISRWYTIDAAISSFWFKAKKLESWIVQKSPYFEDTDFGDIPGKVERKIKIHQAFDSEATSAQNRLDTLREIAKSVAQSGHSDVPKIEGKLNELTTSLKNCTDRGSERRKALEDALATQRKIEDLALEYAKGAEALHSWLEHSEEALSEPIQGINSVADAEKALAQHETKQVDGSKKSQGDLAAVKKVAEEIQSLGDVENIFTSHTVAALEHLANTVTRVGNNRSENLKKELQSQQESEAAVKEYVDKANEFLTWIKTTTEAITALSGSEEDQDESLSKIRSEKDTKKGQLQELERLASRLSARVASTRLEGLAHETLTDRFSEIDGVIKEKARLLEEQVLRKKQSEVSPEQLRDYKECFSHFDQDEDDTLSIDEFKACLSSLGQDLTDEALEELFLATDTDGNQTVSFDEFVELMAKRTRDSDSKEDVLDAFKLITNGKDSISEKELQEAGFLDEHGLEYIVSQLKKSNGGKEADAYSFQKLVDDMFSR